MTPPCFTEAQWSDIMDWYLSGYENGRAAGYAAAYQDAYAKAMDQWVGLSSTEPKTAYYGRKAA